MAEPTAGVALLFARTAWKSQLMTEDQGAFEIVVVGAGPAGLAAACVAAESGRRVALVDETPWLGGQIWRGQPGTGLQDHQTTGPQDHKTTDHKTKVCGPVVQWSGGPLPWLARFRRSGACWLAGTTIIAAPEPGLLLAEQDGAPLRIRWQKLVLATGARELFLPFPGWTLPGILGPAGLQALVKNGWPVEGRRVLVAGSGPLLLAVAEGLQHHGARVIGIVEQTPHSKMLSFGAQLWRHPEKLWQAARLRLRLAGVRYRCSAWPVRAETEGHALRITLTNGKETWQEVCDYLACGFGLVPNVELPLAAGCALKGDFVQVNASQATTVDGVYGAGEVTGIGGADCALVEGQIAGYAASDRMASVERLLAARSAWHQFRSGLAEAFALRPELKALANDETVICRCEDVTLGQMRRFSSWREAKLQCRSGMGACQGRTCGAAAKVLLGWGMESVRPPILPARVQSLRGGAE
jgi:D-hydroxyproline dehydrogenase subunit alpha